MVVGAVGTGRSLGNCVYLCPFDLPVSYFMVAWNGLHFFFVDLWSVKHFCTYIT